MSTVSETENVEPQKLNATLEMHVMDRTGDTKHIWDRNKPEEVTAARELFNSLKKKGYAGYRVTGEKGDKGEVMQTFDDRAERMIMAAPMVGG